MKIVKVYHVSLEDSWLNIPDGWKDKESIVGDKDTFTMEELISFNFSELVLREMELHP